MLTTISAENRKRARHYQSELDPLLTGFLAVKPNQLDKPMIHVKSNGYAFAVVI